MEQPVGEVAVRMRWDCWRSVSGPSMAALPERAGAAAAAGVGRCAGLVVGSWLVLGPRKGVCGGVWYSTPSSAWEDQKGQSDTTHGRPSMVVNAVSEALHDGLHVCASLAPDHVL